LHGSHLLDVQPSLHYFLLSLSSTASYNHLLAWTDHQYNKFSADTAFYHWFHVVLITDQAPSAGKDTNRCKFYGVLTTETASSLLLLLWDWVLWFYVHFFSSALHRNGVGICLFFFMGCSSLFTVRVYEWLCKILVGLGNALSWAKCSERSLQRVVLRRAANSNVGLGWFSAS